MDMTFIHIPGSEDIVRRKIACLGISVHRNFQSSDIIVAGKDLKFGSQGILMWSTNHLKNLTIIRKL